MKVAVTGGSGVVGQAVLRHLVMAGHEVGALARSDQSSSIVTEHGATAVPGDVLDRHSLSALVRGAAWVFHLAGVNQTCSPNPALMDQVNIEGTRNVIDACRQTGVPRLVFTSSAVTIGEEHGALGSEATRHRGSYYSRYERSKHLAEQLLFRESGELDVVAVNPSSVQGPGRASGTGKLILDVINGRVPILVDKEMSIVDIDDCAEGHLLAAEKGESGARYILSGSTMKMNSAVAMIESVTGRRLRVRYAPGWLLKAGAVAVEFGARFTSRTPPICREMANVMLAGHRYDGTLASRELGVEYTPVEQTIARTIAWFEEQGLLI